MRADEKGIIKLTQLSDNQSLEGVIYTLLVAQHEHDVEMAEFATPELPPELVGNGSMIVGMSLMKQAILKALKCEGGEPHV